MNKTKDRYLFDKRLALLAPLLLAGAVGAFFRVGSVPVDISTTRSLPVKKRLASYSNQRLPVSFVPNRSQLDERVEYYAVGAGYSFFLTKNEAAYSFIKRKAPLAKGGAGTKTYSLKIRFAGANSDAAVSGKQELQAKVNYFRGRDPEKWRSNISTYRQVFYRDLYDGIDMVYKGDRQKIKYEFRVGPGADYRKIRLVYQGIDSLAVDARGDLLIETPIGKLRDKRPYMYQVVKGKRVRVRGDFAVDGHTASFLAGNYDPSLPLIIDPGLLYSTFIGGGSMDYGVDLLALDPGGSAYLTGYTSSINYPTVVGSYDTSQNGGTDAFVTKLNPAGSALVYSTYLGGSGNDYGYGLTLDSAQNAYVSGHTFSADFPTTAGAYDTTLATSPDVFAAKLSPSGSALIYSTYLGGAAGDYGRGVAVDGGGNAFLTGYTSSADFPTTVGAFDTSYNGGADVFAAKLDSSGTALAYSTFIGGGSADYGYNLAVNPSGNAFITGSTLSGGWPATAGAFDTSYNGGGDAYAVKVSSTGAGLDYATFIGGGGADYGYAITLDASENAYLAGQTNSAGFPVTGGSYDTTINGGYDGYALKLSPTGASLGYSTFLGGNLDDYAYGVSVDASGSAYLTGLTNSAGFPVTADAYNNTHGGAIDAFVSKMNPSGTSLGYSTFLGGANNDYGYSVVVDPWRNIFITGQTNSANFPTTPGAFDGSNSGFDAFVTKMDIITPTTSIATTPTVPDGAGGWFVSTTTVSLTADETATTYYQWDSTSGPWTIYAGPFNAPSGSHTLNYYSADSAANTETVKAQGLAVDTAAPADPVAASTSHSLGGWSNNNVIDISMDGATDSASGVDGFSVAWSTGPAFPVDDVKDLEEIVTTTTSGPLSDGAWYFHFRTVDNAGNWTLPAHIGPYNIDTIAPLTSISTSPPAPDGDSGWYKSPLAVTLTRSDTGTTNYQWDSTAPAGWDSFITPSSDLPAPAGQHTLYYYSFDLANTETINNTAYKVDAAPPTSVILAGIGATPTSVSLNWTVSVDPQSGLAGYHIFDADTDVDLVTTATISYIFTGLAPGTTYRYYVRAKDVAGNYSSPSNTLTVTTPSMPPLPPAPATGLNMVALFMAAQASIGAGLLALGRRRRRKRF